MNCCDANGDCTQGRDCPARKPVKFPFAPGAIEGPKNADWSGLGDDGAMLTRRQNLSVLLLVLLLAVLGSVLGGFLAGYLPWPTWLTVGLPG